MSKSAPDAPDYAAAAQEQAQSSREVTNMQTYANRPEQNTPWGSTSWSNAAVIDPATGQPVTAWQQNTSLTPEAQRALTSQLGITADRSDLARSLVPRLQSEYGSAMNWDQFMEMGGIPNAPQYGTEDIQRGLSTEGLQNVDPSQRYAQEAEDALYGKFTSRADPRFAREEDQTRTRLYNQGFREGDQGFGNEMDTFNQNKNDAYGQASFDAALKGGEEASRYYGMDSGTRAQQFGERGSQGAFANSAANQALQQNMAAGQANFGNAQSQSNMQTQQRQQQIAEQMQQRGFSLNEINAILSGQQVNMPSMPGFQNAQRSEGVQSLSAAQMTGQAELDRFNAQQQATQGMISGVGGMAGGAMMMSDRRLKKNIQRIGTLAGFPLYIFDYLWGETGIGVMSDEVPAQFVHRHASGYDMVDYGSLRSV